MTAILFIASLVIAGVGVFCFFRARDYWYDAEDILSQARESNDDWDWPTPREWSLTVHRDDPKKVYAIQLDPDGAHDAPEGFDNVRVREVRKIHELKSGGDDA